MHADVIPACFFAKTPKCRGENVGNIVCLPEGLETLVPGGIGFVCVEFFELCLCEKLNEATASEGVAIFVLLRGFPELFRERYVTLHTAPALKE